MIKQTTYKIITVILLIVFIAASTGINLFIHICSCSQRSFTSIYENHKCQEVEVASCCSFSEIKQSPTACECGCNTIHLTIKVNDLFNKTNPTVINPIQDFATFYQFFHHTDKLNLTIEGFSESKNRYSPTDSPPVKPVGRILVYLLHQSKTPALLS